MKTIRPVTIYVVLAVVLAWTSVLANAEILSGNPRVIDGDTLALSEDIVRLHGIDAAESGQRCIAPGGKIVRPGDQAEVRLVELSTSGITCVGATRDQYGRLIAVCRNAANIELNRTLVREGLAWAFVKYSLDYVDDERAARDDHVGIWSIRCEQPWAFRAKRWEVAIQKAPNSCPIKGNISQRGRIYHTPWSRHYSRTKVDIGKGERWFCSEGEALKAGWRPPIR